MCSASRSATWSAVLLSSLISIPIRVERSTRVATALAAVGADDQVAFPVAGHGPVFDLGGSFGDVDHPDDLRPGRAAAAAAAAGAGPARNAGTQRAPCAARLWPARRSLGRSPRATPTTVAHRDDHGAAVERSARVTTSWSAAGAGPPPTATAAARSSPAWGVARPYRHADAPDRPDTAGARHRRRSHDRSCRDADPTGQRSPCRSHHARSRHGSLRVHRGSTRPVGACDQSTPAQPGRAHTTATWTPATQPPLPQRPTSPHQPGPEAQPRPLTEQLSTDPQDTSKV